jgi:hypothetical protein
VLISNSNPLSLLLAFVSRTQLTAKSAALIIIALAIFGATGCQGVEKLRGEGFKESDDWGGNLRGKSQEGPAHGGVSTKAQQIERNLGVN